MSTLGERMTYDDKIVRFVPRNQRPAAEVRDEIYSRAWKRWMRANGLRNELSATPEQRRQFRQFLEEERRLAGPDTSGR